MLLMGGVMMMPKRQEHYETRQEEAYIVSKEIKEVNGETAYLLHGEDSAGREVIYQVTQRALNDRMDVENVYKEIRRRKYYQFKVVDGEKYGCPYPCICGAAMLIEGFSEETAAAK